MSTDPTEGVPPPPPPRARLEALGFADLVARYRMGPTQFHASLLEVPDESLDTFFLPEAGVGRWSVRTLVGHLADVELLMVQRLRRIAAEEAPLLGGYDEDAAIDAGLYLGADKPVAGFLAVLVSVRNWCGEWLTTLDRSVGERRALHPELGEVRFIGVLSYATWHLEHHARFLHLKLQKLDRARHDTPA
ncbi:MAG: DinB family protein [Planctomycetota bacterium]